MEGNEMVNMQSPVVQSAMQNGANFGQPYMMNMGAGYNEFMNPPQPMYYQPQPMMQSGPVDYQNTPLYVQRIANKPYDMLHSNQPGTINYNGGYPNMGYPPYYGQMPRYGYQQGAYPQYGQGKINPLMSVPTQQQQARTYTVEGFNPLGTDKIISTDLEKKLKDLDDKYNDLNDQKMAERESIYAENPYNYYGYMNTNYLDPLLVSQYNRELQALQQEAVQNRIDLNERLSKAVHYYRQDIDIDNEEEWKKVQQAYLPKTIEIPESTFISSQEADALRQTVDITEQLRNQAMQINAKVTEEHNRLVNPNSNMMEFFDHAGLILWQNAFDELQHHEKLARRNRYSRRDFIKYLKGEGKKYDRDIKIPDGFEDRENRYNPNDAFYSLFPNLREEDGWSMEDGTLSLSYPKWKEHQNAIVNQEQSNYERQRLEFANAVYNKVDPRDPRYGGGFN
jgi:hypothetical protein